jgi:hypothetical protein
MNIELDRLNLEEFIERNLLDIKDKVTDISYHIDGQLECCRRRIKNIKKDIESYEDTMENEGLVFDNLTPIEEENHGTQVTR